MISKKNKILYVVPKMGRGGAQQIVADLARGMSNNGWNVDLLILYRTPQDKEHIEGLESKINIINLQKNGVAKLKADSKSLMVKVLLMLRLPFLVSSWVRRGLLEDYVVVHCHLLAGSYTVWLMKLFARFYRLRRPLIVETFHADFTVTPFGVRWLFIFFWTHLDVLVTELRYRDYEYLRSRLRNVSVQYLPFGVDRPADSGIATKLFISRYGIRENIPLIVTIARLNNKEKHIDSLIRVVAQVKKKISCEFQYLICGDGEDKGIIKKDIIDEGLSEMTIFTGYVNNVFPPLKLARVFLIAGVEDIVGIAGLQAALMGVPVVVYQTDPLWKNDKSFFNSSRSIDSLSNEICTLLTDDSFYDSQGKYCFQIASDNFTLEVMIESYRQLYLKSLRT